MVEIGQFELNQNVRNYVAGTEQAAFSPSYLMPSVGVSPDKMLQARVRDVNQLPVNAPRCPVHG